MHEQVTLGLVSRFPTTIAVKKSKGLLVECYKETQWFSVQFTHGVFFYRFSPAQELPTCPHIANLNDLYDVIDMFSGMPKAR